MLRIEYFLAALAIMAFVDGGAGRDSLRSIANYRAGDHGSAVRLPSDIVSIGTAGSLEDPSGWTLVMKRASARISTIKVRRAFKAERNSIGNDHKDLEPAARQVAPLLHIRGAPCRR